jgi:hypothetical protein
MRKGNRLNREGQRRRAIGIAISALLVLVAIVLVVAGGDGGEAEVEAEAVETPARLVEREEIAALEDSLGHPVYWAGERWPDRLELAQEADGNVFVRYLPPGTEAGDERAGFLTVGTYPFTDPVAGLKQTAAESGGEVRAAPDGTAMLVDPASDSVYLAYPDSELQVEVYDPAGGALELIEAGEIEPAG